MPSDSEVNSILGHDGPRDLLKGIFSPYLTSLENLKDIYIFGAGRTGRDLAGRLRVRGVGVRAFLDNRAHGRIIDDLPCMPPEEANGDAPIAIATGYQFEIIQQLRMIGRQDYIPYTVLGLWYSLPRELFLSDIEEIVSYKHQYSIVCDRLEDDLSRTTLKAILQYRTTLDPSHLAKVALASDGQYFDPEIFDISKVKTFVDAGGFDGATTCDFIKCTGGQYDRVYYFEPDTDLFNDFQKRFSDENRISFFNKAVTDKPGLARFVASGDMQGHLLGPDKDESGSRSVSVECVSLDSVVTGRVDLIKLDIEGAECDALRGATNLLQTKPVLALAYDHSCRDLWRVIDVIDSLSPGYKYYVRHYGGTVTETVLYAVPENL